MTTHPVRILRIDASMRRQGSVSRQLADELIERLSAEGPTTVVHRDLADPLPVIDEAWIAANFTAPEERGPAMRSALALSDSLVDELKAADVIVIATPIYNFGVPAALKIWIDLVCRARLTFAYTSEGPKGLLADKRVYIVAASGGTAAGSEIDFATGYLRHVMGFIGLTDVQLVDGTTLMADADAALARARAQMAA